MKTDSRTIARLAIAAIIAGAAACTLAVGGCNTVKGAGKDIQAVGEAGQEAINK